MNTLAYMFSYLTMRRLSIKKLQKCNINEHMKLYQGSVLLVIIYLLLLSNRSLSELSSH